MVYNDEWWFLHIINGKPAGRMNEKKINAYHMKPAFIEIYYQ